MTICGHGLYSCGLHGGLLNSQSTTHAHMDTKMPVENFDGTKYSHGLMVMAYIVVAYIALDNIVTTCVSGKP